MRPLSAQRALSATALATALLVILAGCMRQRAVVLGFWFEPVSYNSSRLGSALTSKELQTIASVARSELALAFAELRVTLSEHHDARYRVRVVQHLQDPRFRGAVGVAGSSRAVSMFGGDGAVSFSLLAAYAESYAPADATRNTIVFAVGRGVGRAAVHEFAHQLLGSAGFHEGADAQSYEYGSAARPEQYYGALHWGTAWPALQKRLGQPAGP